MLGKIHVRILLVENLLYQKDFRMTWLYIGWEWIDAMRFVSNRILDELYVGLCPKLIKSCTTQLGYFPL